MRSIDVHGWGRSMSATIGVAAVLALVLAAATLWYRRVRLDDPGAVSHRWISEHRAQHPQDGPRGGGL